MDVVNNLFEKLKSECEIQLESKKLTDEKYKIRLEEELKEIRAQDATEYFLNLQKEGHKLENENNLLVPYLLGIVDNVDIEKEAKYDVGDWPDVDVDYLPSIRNYLKEQYARSQFGDDYVCNIATYTTFGLRSSLIDMAKVFDLDRKEILALTTRLGIKDDEGEVLTWDKAIELYDDLRNYLEKHPDMADAARRILHRNRNMGMHASGLIISKVPIDEFVPLVKIKDGAGACSAWVEGLHGTDLGAVGLVKFDFLSLEGNTKIAQATHLVENIDGNAGANNVFQCCNALETADKIIGKVSALPGKSNWSDTSYLDDPKTIEMANKGDLKMIFQYDGSEGIRRLAKQGGVTSFDDLAAYTALYRPSCLKYGMHDTYCKRKRGEEKYELHPLLEPILGKTYGVMVFQESIMRILNVVGNIPLKDCETVRKAISKKKVDKFKKYKEMFVTNGQKNLSLPEEEVVKLWDQIEAFAGYGFNMSHCVAYTYISARMLYLKAHHPLAFYTSVIDCTKAAGPKDYAKIKDYKMEAMKHGIKVNRVDVNKSKFEISAQDGQIYWGFSKIKGVGDDAALRMQQMQPYVNYEDFLIRFGTDAKANQAVIALQLFPGDQKKMYHFYQEFKAWEKKRTDRMKRHNDAIERHAKNLSEILGYEFQYPLTQTYFDKLRAEIPCDKHKALDSLWKKVKKTRDTYDKNESERPPSFDSFEIDESCDPIPEDYLNLIGNIEAADEEYYGFVWDHPLEKAKHYNHKTFENFETENNEVGPIDVMVRQTKQMKGPKATYYSVEVEDATGQTRRVTIWTDDFKRFEHLLTKGNCVRMTVKAPTQGFSNFTLYTPGNRWQKPSKSTDLRVFPLN